MPEKPPTEEKVAPGVDSGSTAQAAPNAPVSTGSSVPPPPAPPATPTSDSMVSQGQSKKAKDKTDLISILSDRAIKAGSRGRLGKEGIAPHGKGAGGIAPFSSPSGALAMGGGKYLVVGDNMIGPFMALCLRLNGLNCDLAHHPSTSDCDRGVIVLTPSVTQVMGDALSVNVPSGSVIGRILVFDHVGNDMCDVDLNEFRQQGESPTFFACDRPKIESSLLSLCKIGHHSCQVLANPAIEKGGLQAIPGGGVRVTFASGVTQDYLGVISTARNQSLVPELLHDDQELRWREENSAVLKKQLAVANRFLEVCVPPLPEHDGFTKRFTPGSQEVVELITPRDTKISVRPTMMATKLFYNVTMSIPDSCPDPRLKSTSMKMFWDQVIEAWTAGVPGYISHTMFKPMFTHVQQHFVKSSALYYKSPIFLMPHWVEGEGRVMKIGQSVHGSCFDAIDVSDAQSFTDCMILARALAAGDDIKKVLADRRLQVMEELDNHAILVDYALKERGQWKYVTSRFGMKLLRRYKKAWRRILTNYVTMLPK